MEVTKQAEDKMQKSIDFMVNEFKAVRTGRANPALVENVKVECYGTPTPLKQIASITTPDARTLFIKAFDNSILINIEKAIMQSDLGLNPQNDGKIIRILIPTLSEERRRQLADHVKGLGEKAKVSIRNIRRDTLKHVEDSEKQRKITEDMKFRVKDELTKLSEKLEKKVDELIQKKIKEVMES